MIDQQTFKEVMAAAPGPATIITAIGADGRPQGLTMTAACSASLEPPLLLVCLAHDSNTLRAVRESASFTVNYLAHGHADIALHFATKSDSKFDGLDVAVDDSAIGGPILHGVIAAHAVCRVESLAAAGDHTVVVGAVVDGAASADTPVLAYARRRFFADAMQSATYTS